MAMKTGYEEESEILEDSLPAEAVVPFEEPVEEEVEKDEEDISRILLQLMKTAEEEDHDFRFTLLNIWRRNTLYFNNVLNIFYDPVAKDYRTFESAYENMQAQAPTNDIKQINVYRAYAESMIAALSVAIPSVHYLPEDAENPDDIETAKTYALISEVVQDHNKSPLMLIKALTTLYNQGVIFGYNYYKTDPNYGVVKSPKEVETKEKTVYDLQCRQCGHYLEYNVPESVLPEQSKMFCNECGADGPPNTIAKLEFFDEVTQWESTPKGRSGFDIFGPTGVKVPLYAKRQEDFGYLILRLEEACSKVKTVYGLKEVKYSGGDTQKYEAWARLPIDYNGELPKHLTTVRYGFFRPMYYNELPEEDAEWLFEKYPNGILITACGEEVLEYEHTNLDDHWTTSFDPRADFIHAEPCGSLAVPIQDAKVDMFNLGLQSIAHGIGETFVNPKTLDLNKYSKGTSTPGMLTQAKPPAPDRSLADGFFSLKPAILSSEYVNFDGKLDSTGQFITGALPSIWGGALKTGETTATETSNSRGQALQRLQITWRVTTSFWGEMISKCVKDFAKNLREDENFSKKQKNTYVNVWIRKASLSGKVGQIKPEVSEQLPQSWSQKRDFLMRIIEMQVPEIGAILLHPNNVEIVKEAIGMPEFYIPGEHDRNKQWAEFYILAESNPIDDNTPSVPIDLVVDDHGVHMEVLKNILVGPVGIALYQQQPAYYQNCIAHYRHHEMAQMAKTTNSSGISLPGEQAETVAPTTQG
jgi:hypothetical protein